MYFGEASLAAYVTPLVATRIRAPEDQQQNFTARACSALFRSRLKIVDAQLAKYPHMAGDFSAADISVTYALTFGTSFGLDQFFSPAIADYLARMKARPAYQRATARPTA
jgi:glutathione S-transferase